MLTRTVHLDRSRRQYCMERSGVEIPCVLRCREPRGPEHDGKGSSRKNYDRWPIGDGRWMGRWTHVDKKENGDLLRRFWGLMVFAGAAHKEPRYK